MKISDATDIKLGSTSASKVMLGTTQVWPSSPMLDAPDSVQYNSITTGGWGNNVLTSGSHYNISGSQWFASWGTGINQPSGSNITYNYAWSFTGDVTLVQTETTAVGDPRGDNLPLFYKFTFGGGAATLTMTDLSNFSRVLFTATFN